MANKIIHKHSSDPKLLPGSNELEYGELAVNFADGFETISLKNSNDEIVEFKSKEYYDGIIENATEELNNKLDKSTFDALAEGDVTTAIESFKEVTAFLEGIEDDETLKGVLAGKQNTLVSGENIKTINGESVLGSGDITIDFTIDDIEEIRQGAKLGETSTQGFEVLFGTLRYSDGQYYFYKDPDNLYEKSLYEKAEDAYNNNKIPVLKIGTWESYVLLTKTNDKYFGNGISNFQNYQYIYTVELNQYEDCLKYLPFISEHQDISGKQDSLISGTNIKTINGESILDSGDINLQPTLVSGENIKTINGESVLGSGDITIDFTEGESCEESGINSHAEGRSTTSSGEASHAEGINSEAIGEASHAEGYQTKAGFVNVEDGTISGNYSHAEGDRTEAIGDASHAEGYETEAIGVAAHAEGYGTIAYNKGEHACGRFNESIASEDATDTEEAVVGTVFSVGIGSSTTDRKNVLDIREDGRIYIWLNGEYVCLQDLLISAPNQQPLPPQYSVMNEVGEEELNNIVNDYLDKGEE